MSVTHISLWNVGVLTVSWVIFSVLFNLLLQTCSISPLILINSNPVPEEQERWCGWDVVGCCCSLKKKKKLLWLKNTSTLTHLKSNNWSKLSLPMNTWGLICASTEWGFYLGLWQLSEMLVLHPPLTEKPEERISWWVDQGTGSNLWKSRSNLTEMDSMLHNVWGCYHGYMCNNENTILFPCCKILQDGTQVVDVLTTLTWHTWTSTSRKTTCGYLLLSMLKAGAILTQGWQLGREDRACYRSILGPAGSSEQCYQVHKSEVKNERNYTV